MNSAKLKKSKEKMRSLIKNYHTFKVIKGI